VARSYLHTYPDRRAKVTPELLARWQQRGGHALAVMEQRLATHDWLVGSGYTVADIALYAYTHVAGDGGFDLAKYPGISRWLARVAAPTGSFRVRAREFSGKWQIWSRAGWSSERGLPGRLRASLTPHSGRARKGRP